MHREGRELIINSTFQELLREIFAAGNFRMKLSNKYKMKLELQERK